MALTVGCQLTATTIDDDDRLGTSVFKMSVENT